MAGLAIEGKGPVVVALLHGGIGAGDEDAGSRGQLQDLDHQRIVEHGLALAVEGHVTIGLLILAEGAIGQGQHVVGAGDARVDGQRAFQQVDGAAVIVVLGGDAAQSQQGRGTAGVDGQGPLKGLAGLGQFVLFEEVLGLLDQGGHEVGIEGQGCRHLAAIGFPVAQILVDHGLVPGPGQVVGLVFSGMSVAGEGGLVQVLGVVAHAQATDRAGPVDRGCLVIGQQLVHGLAFRLQGLAGLLF